MKQLPYLVRWVIMWSQAGSDRNRAIHLDRILIPGLHRSHAMSVIDRHVLFVPFLHLSSGRFRRINHPEKRKRIRYNEKTEKRLVQRSLHPFYLLLEPVFQIADLFLL